VEGHEQAVFQGAVRLLAEQSPVLVFECEARHLDQGSVTDVFGFLAGLGYGGRFVDGRRLRPISEFRVEKHQRQAEGKFWNAKDYRNNFVFSRAPAGA
jgi:hypothetical protein